MGQTSADTQREITSLRLEITDAASELDKRVNEMLDVRAHANDARDWALRLIEEKPGSGCPHWRWNCTWHSAVGCQFSQVAQEKEDGGCPASRFPRVIPGRSSAPYPRRSRLRHEKCLLYQEPV